MRPAAAIRSLAAAAALAVLSAAAAPAAGQAPAPDPDAARQAPQLAYAVAAGQLPPLAQRLPRTPAVARLLPGQSVGRYGGELVQIMGRARDTRIMFVFAYSRLMRWTPDLELVPDILERVDVEEGRIFTLHLREGHRWSDGHPFTTEDFRYWWEDIANEPALTPFGPPAEIRLDREAPTVEVLSPTAVRFSWSKPNPFFLPALAGARPLQIFAPAHYLRRFHQRHADPAELQARVQAAGQRGWAQLHNRLDNAYDYDNPEMPTLQPWVPTTAPPAERFVYVRNPYFHRVDPEGRQLPYIDRLVMNVADARLVPAKAGAGETDLQARYVRFDSYTFLREGERRNGYGVRLWKHGSGAHLALFPNLNASDAVWRGLLRDVRFRRALSLAIDREEINQVVYFGLAEPSQNTVLPESPLFRPAYRQAFSEFDLDAANRLLDEVGLSRRDRNGTRLLPDGRPLEIIVETAGETEETDVLQLIGDTWRKAGIRLFARPAQLDVLRNRIYAGDAVMVLSKGIDNGIPTAAMAPTELVPVDQAQYQWPKWGQFWQTGGGAGEAPDIPAARELIERMRAWQATADRSAQAEAWHRILEIHAENLFTIGLIAGVQQPVVVRDTLRNVPDQALFNWDPGAFFGIYGTDTFWFDQGGRG
jgi:peptide/nickel transport system substrate-binding protein